MSQVFEHRPVMVAEITAVFGDVPPGLVVDATVGGGGHARALLGAHPHLRLLGIDRDADALAAARSALALYGERVRVVRARFDHVLVPGRGPDPGLLAEAGTPAPPGAVSDLITEPLSGVLFDLGVSSYQFDAPERGFSYRAEAPLDMRMDRSTGATAADVVNEWPEADLADLFREHGEGRFARRVAHRITEHRPIRTTTQLADVVRDAIPAPARRTGGHPAKRVFQALRVAVNEELDILPGALDAAIDLLAPGGRVAVLSYHSGEDRIVKDRFLAAATGGCTCPPHLPCTCGAQPRARLLTRGARKPSPAEVAANPRASSARLRILEALGGRDER